MDLLRLVLARQPLIKLAKMPALHGNIRFLRVRAGIVNVMKHLPTDRPYEEACALEGELVLIATKSIKPSNLCNRSIFLLSPSLLRYFARVAKLDFWYAISSGDKEIIRIAFDYAELYPLVLSDCNDLESIPWTESLRKLFQSKSALIQRCIEAGGNAVMLVGFLDLKHPKFGWNNYYFLGYCKWRLLSKGGSTWDPDADIEKKLSARPSEVYTTDPFQIKLRKQIKYHDLVAAGYLHPILGMYNSGEDWIVLLRFAIGFADKKLMSYILLDLGVQAGHVGFQSSAIITRTFVKKVEEILDDSTIVELLPENVVAAYKVIAGYKIAGIFDENVGASVGNPGPYIPHVEENFKYPHKLKSIQGIVIYDPKYMYQEGVVWDEILRIGWGNA